MLPAKRQSNAREEENRLEHEKKKIKSLFMNELNQKFLFLFESKHLYQNLRLDFSSIDQMIKPTQEIVPQNSYIKEMQSFAKIRSDNNIKAQLKVFFESLLKRKWRFDVAEYIPLEAISNIDAKTSSEFIIDVPTIKIACSNCDSILPPHNPHCHYNKEFDSLDLSKENKEAQVWAFAFLCQSCKKKPIVFLVKREGLILSIVGRSEIEDVIVSKDLPKEEKRWIKDAIISYNCGKTLAAIFFLRTFIEQYWRRILKIGNRISGDEMGDEYQKGLPEDFPKNRCTSLKKLYEELSECLHSANDDEDRYHTSLNQITKHFELLKHFEK